jgi:hypothetical protein
MDSGETPGQAKGKRKERERQEKASLTMAEGRAKLTAPPCRSSTLLHAARQLHRPETYKERAALSESNHSLSGVGWLRQLRQNGSQLSLSGLDWMLWVVGCGMWDACGRMRDMPCRTRRRVIIRRLTGAAVGLQA